MGNLPERGQSLSPQERHVPIACDFIICFLYSTPSATLLNQYRKTVFRTFPFLKIILTVRNSLVNGALLDVIAAQSLLQTYYDINTNPRLTQAVRFVLLLSRQGKVRLAKWYLTLTQKERAKVIKEVTALVLSRAPKLCNFLDWKDSKVVYKRYASLYFIVGVDADDNELLALETIHAFVEVLDKYFGNVCELDLIFNFHKAYFILDELLLAGEVQEPSKRVINRVMEAQDQLVEQAKLGMLPEQNRVPMGPRG